MLEGRKTWPGNGGYVTGYSVWVPGAWGDFKRYWLDWLGAAIVEQKAVSRPIQAELYTSPHILLSSQSSCSPGSNTWQADWLFLYLQHCLEKPGRGAKNTVQWAQKKPMNIKAMRHNRLHCGSLWWRKPPSDCCHLFFFEALCGRGIVYRLQGKCLTHQQCCLKYCITYLIAI